MLSGNVGNDKVGNNIIIMGDVGIIIIVWVRPHNNIPVM